LAVGALGCAEEGCRPLAKKTPARPRPNDPASLVPRMGMVLLVYVVIVIFIWYLIYEYDPITIHRFFSWLFNRFIT
jgi:hypothetical protein